MSSSANHEQASTAALTLGALGVVFGDIGTSVLYSLSTIFSSEHISPTPEHVYGVLSLVFWTLTVIVSLKYVLLVLRADNHGEGGLVAMLALVSQALTHKPKLRTGLLVTGIFGACLFYGDGVITPAISVLSAVEGLEVASPHMKSYVIPLTLAILFLLFWVQKKGTAGIGKFFGPIMVLWFVAIAALGFSHIIGNPAILWAVNPIYAWHFALEAPTITFLILGAVVLCVTGGEALYADMGHFGRRPIQIAWYGAAMPALVINYFGQGALMLSNPAAVENPFFMMAPSWALLPLVGLATLATVIASQALISGAFSVTKQIIQLGFLPRLQVLQTNAHASGQIYIPLVNWALFVMIVLAVGLFRTSTNLAGAYGIAVTTDMLITTTLTFFVLRYVWKLPLWISIAPTAFFWSIDFAFWTSNLLKLLEGGWFPLLIAGSVFLLMLTWHQGRAQMARVLNEGNIDLVDMLDAIFVSPPARVAGTAVFLNPMPDKVPNALMHNLKHNKVLHAYNVFVNVRTSEIPWIDPAERLSVRDLGHNCWAVQVNCGFMDTVRLPQALTAMSDYGCEFNPMLTSYFLSSDTVVAGSEPTMALWRKKLFAHMHHNASNVANFLGLPSNAVVELGAKVEI